MSISGEVAGDPIQNRPDVPLVLSVCVIGRNEKATLAGAARSFRALHNLGVLYETIYVDSASSDGSADLAIGCFDRVVVLRSSPNLNASAGRHIGTLKACGKWMLYLDGDMALRPEFADRLADHLAGDGASGLVGHTRNIAPDGGISWPLAGYNITGEPARLFGGACLLLRSQVLAAGNWNPRLYSNEEVELYGRLIGVGACVNWTDDIMVDHYTPRVAALTMLRSMFIPFRSVLGKKFYGAGQAVAASVLGGTFLSFVKVRQKPLLFALGVTAALITAGTRNASAALALLAITCATAVLYGGWKAPVLHLALMVQTALGMWRYPREYHPEIAREWSADAGWNSADAKGLAPSAPATNG